MRIATRLNNQRPAHLPPLNLLMPLSNAVFYAGCFWLFCLLFSVLMSRPLGPGATTPPE